MADKAPRKDKLTKKQRAFVKEYIKTENGTQSALKAYEIESSNPENVAKAIASENLTKPTIINAIHAALPDELLAQVHVEGLRAVKMDGKGAMRLGLNEDGGVEDFGHSEIQMPDFAVRHKYLDSAYKLKGYYAPDRQININVDIEPSDEIKALAEKLNNV